MDFGYNDTALRHNGHNHKHNILTDSHFTNPEKLDKPGALQ